MADKIIINCDYTEIDGNPGQSITSNIKESDPNYPEYQTIFDAFKTIMEKEESREGKLEITVLKDMSKIRGKSSD